MITSYFRYDEKYPKYLPVPNATNQPQKSKAKTIGTLWFFIVLGAFAAGMIGVGFTDAFNNEGMLYLGHGAKAIATVLVLGTFVLFGGYKSVKDYLSYRDS